MSVEELASPFRHLLRDRATASRTFRHLLRDLLRETTYLPDPWLRAYYRSYVLSRFQAYLHEPAQTRAWVEDQTSYGNPDTRRDEWPRRKNGYVRPSARKPDRQLHLFQQGRRELKMLVSANLGHEQPLFRVMRRAYGRTGERKYRLLEKVWQDKVPEDADELAKIMRTQMGQLGIGIEGPDLGEALRGQPLSQELVNARSKTKMRPKPEVPELPTAIIALIKQQTKESALHRWDGPDLAPKIPQTNAWKRPMPVVRVRNIIRDWLLELKSKLLPPLPDHEFTRLRRLVSGDVEGLVTPTLEKTMPRIMPVREYSHPFHQPQRRPTGTIRRKTGRLRERPTAAAKSKGFVRPFLRDDDGTVGSEPDVNEFDGENLSLESSFPLNPETVSRNLVATKHAHHLTASYLRRLYARLLDMTCSIQNAENKPEITWGRDAPEWRNILEERQRDEKGAAKSNMAASRAGRSDKSITSLERSDVDSLDSHIARDTESCPSDAWMFRKDVVDVCDEGLVTVLSSRGGQ